MNGWDRQDYGVLNGLKDVVVLQMANPDVSDETLRRGGSLAFRGSQSPTSLEGFKDWLLTNANNLLVIPEWRIGTDFAAAGVGARFHRGFLEALARSGALELGRSGGVGRARATVVDHWAQPRRGHRTPGGLAIPAALPAGARGHDLRRTAIEGVLSASIADEVWGLLKQRIAAHLILNYHNRLRG